MVQMRKLGIINFFSENYSRRGVEGEKDYFVLAQKDYIVLIQKKIQRIQKFNLIIVFFFLPYLLSSFFKREFC
jgi:hypothetical protein